jgi:lysophospholipase L1-like esterase
MADSVQTLRQVATGTHIPNALATGSLTTSFSRTPHILRSVVAALAIVLPNWYVAGQTETNAGSATWTAAIEYPAGTFTRVTFGGAASVTSSSGGNIVSDLMPVTIPKGATFWVRLFQNAPGKVVYSTFYAGDGTAQFTSPATDWTMGGAVTTAVSRDAPMTAPIAIIGMSSDPAIGIYGDSISVGRGDTADAGVPLQGHLGRAFGAAYAAGHVGISGDRMSLFLGSKAKRMSLASYFTHFAVNMGINDITSGGSASSIAADTDAIVGLFPGPVALCTLSPVSTSTDTWNTVASQTTVASNAVRVSENTRRLGGVSGVKVVYDVNPSVESVASPESGLWRASAYTADGTHPAAKGYKEEASAINVALLAAPQQPAQDAVVASTVAESRRVAFPGGTRVVKFGTVPSVRMPNAPYLEAGKWWSEKHPLDERYWVADITIDLAERGTTAVTVEAIVAGVTVLQDPVIQGKLIPVKLGGFNAATGAVNFCTFRVRCADGQRFDRTIWFKQQVGAWSLNKDADDESYFVADIGNDLADSNTTATQVKALPVGVVELVPAAIQGPLILVKLGSMDTLPAGVNYCDLRIDCANSERFYRTIQFNRVDN